MDIDKATRLLGAAKHPLVIRCPATEPEVLAAAWRRFEAAGGHVLASDGDMVTIELGPVTLRQYGLGEGMALDVTGTVSKPAGARIVFRVMASLGRGAQCPVELASGESPPDVVFRYRPGGPGLVHVPSGERVSPYDEEG